MASMDLTPGAADGLDGAEDDGLGVCSDMRADGRGGKCRGATHCLLPIPHCPSHFTNFLTHTVSFCPPNPNEFDTAARIGMLRAVFAQ